MSDDRADKSEPGVRTEYGQGYSWSDGDAESFNAVIDGAFDFRGNVTMQMRDGTELVGYVFNRVANGDEPFVDIFPVAGGRERVLYADIRAITFSGKDTAAGKSWETWVGKYSAKKAAEARGESVESIDLHPEELD